MELLRLLKAILGLRNDLLPSAHPGGQIKKGSGDL